MAEQDGGIRWTVALRVFGSPEIVQSRLMLAQLSGVSWYRRSGQLRVSVKLDAPTQEVAEAAAVDLLGRAQIKADVVRSRSVDR